MNKMNILINYLGRNGGGPLNAYESAKAFMENGHCVSAILSSSICNRSEWESLGLKDILFIDTFDNKVQFVINSIIFEIKTKRLIKKYYQSQKFDLIYVPMMHFWTSKVNDVIDNKKVVTVVHDPLPHTGQNMYVFNSFVKIAKKSNDIVVHSKEYIDVISNDYGCPSDKVHYMPLGRHNLYKQRGNNSNSREKGNNTNFLFFGRIEPYKGLDILLNAYKILEKERTGVSLTIAGNGDLTNYSLKIKELENVKILNRYIADEEIDDLFQNENTITVLPYLDATQSGPLLLAYEYDSLVISSDCPGLIAQLNEGKNGLVFKSGDSSDLLEKMKIALDDYEKVIVLKKNAKEYLKELEWTTLLNNLMIELYE